MIPEVAKIAQTWDPLPAGRVYMRHKQTSDRGWQVVREGREAVRYDRGEVDQYVFNLTDWQLEADDLPKYTDMQIAMVCFEADKKLCWALGMIDLSKREWLQMTEKARVNWMKDGPPKTAKERVALFTVMRDHLRGNR